MRSLFAGDEYAIKKISAFEQAYLDYLGKSLELCQSFYDEYRGRARKDYAIAAQKATVNQRHLFGVIMNMYEGTVDVDKLLKDLKVVQDESDRQAKEIENIGVSIKNLQTTYKGYQENRAARDTSNAKMNKDSKRGNVVAAKPGLVEKQINASFNKFAEDIQEATR